MCVFAREEEREREKERGRECVCVLDRRIDAAVHQVCVSLLERESERERKREVCTCVCTRPLSCCCRNYRSLLQNIVSFIGFLCKRDLCCQGAYSDPDMFVSATEGVRVCVRERDSVCVCVCVCVYYTTTE